MALQSSIIRSLNDAAESGDQGILKSSFHAINMSLSSQTTHRVGLEALVICAEVSLKVWRTWMNLITRIIRQLPCNLVCMRHAQMTNLEIAKKCLEMYMLEVRQYSGNVAPVEVCDQYLCRAYIALGQLVSEQSKTLKVGSGPVPP